MNLKSNFIKATEQAFNVFNEAVLEGTYTSETDYGWEEYSVSSVSIRIIFDNLKQEDYQFLDLVHSTDVKGLVPGSDLEGVEKVSVKNKIKVDSIEYQIEHFEVDPYSILYTFLLRKV